MMVEKVPDSTYEMVGGLDKQIKEIKEVIELPVKHPELFDALGIAQPKVSQKLIPSMWNAVFINYLALMVTLLLGQVIWTFDLGTILVSSSQISDLDHPNLIPRVYLILTAIPW